MSDPENYWQLHDVYWGHVHTCCKLREHGGPCECFCGVKLSKVDKFHGSDLMTARTVEHDA